MGAESRAAGLCLADTTVLIAVVDTARRSHRAAVRLFDGQRPLALSPQILREFLVVATRPRNVNGLGLSSEQAAANAAAFADSAITLDEDYRVALRLRQLTGERHVSGKQIHDANLVATALVHGVGSLVTANTRHFARYRDLLDVIALGA